MEKEFKGLLSENKLEGNYGRTSNENVGGEREAMTRNHTNYTLSTVVACVCVCTYTRSLCEATDGPRHEICGGYVCVRATRNVLDSFVSLVRSKIKHEFPMMSEYDVIQIEKLHLLVVHLGLFLYNFRPNWAVTSDSSPKIVPRFT